jgi:hydroxymethylpyrimidine/phosphomethylpyrimidine kinase
MGNVVPDRFFWALPPPEDGDAPAEGDAEPDDNSGPPPGASRRVH